MMKHKDNEECESNSAFFLPLDSFDVDVKIKNGIMAFTKMTQVYYNPGEDDQAIEVLYRFPIDP